MSACAVHPLEVNQQAEFTHAPGEALALVDLETYPSYIGDKADRFDLMAHLAEQMQALTIMSWRAPQDALRFRMLVTENDFLVDQISHANPAQIASGNLRSYGALCLMTHDVLFDRARNRSQDLLYTSPRSKLPRPEILHVPAGIYAVSSYYHTPFHGRNGGLSDVAADVDYLVILRHYAFPPPRSAPVRLSPGLLPWAGDEAASQAWGGRNSHKAPV